MRNLIVILLLFLIGCASDSTDDLAKKQTPETSIVLKWNKAYPDDSIDKAALGLEWALSYCGAVLPNAANGISTGSNTISVDLYALGLDDQALEKLLRLHQKIKTSGEYQATNAIDLGRYVCLLVGASADYYEISGVPQQLDALLGKYNLSNSKGYVNDSEVSLVHRIIQFSQQQNLNQVFLASEVDSISGQVYEYETVEIMPNGQLRFGIFDPNGNRIDFADASHTNAGKPAKCMWCHESHIRKVFRAQNDFAGYLTYQQFQDTLSGFDQTLIQMRSVLPDGIDFSHTQEHTLMELLYISFMEPSAQRLSLEWGISVAQVQQILAGQPTHVYAEFPFLGTLYNRNAIEPFAPFHGLPVSGSVREASAVEVNYLSP